MSFQNNGIYNVMARIKDVNLSLRVRADVRDEFKIVADLRGVSVSALIHQFMVKEIRAEKERDPAAFIPNKKIPDSKKEPGFSQDELIYSEEKSNIKKTG